MTLPEQSSEGPRFTNRKELRGRRADGLINQFGARLLEIPEYKRALKQALFNPDAAGKGRKYELNSNHPFPPNQRRIDFAIGERDYTVEYFEGGPVSGSSLYGDRFLIIASNGRKNVLTIENLYMPGEKRTFRDGQIILTEKVVEKDETDGNEMPNVKAFIDQDAIDLIPDYFPDFSVVH